MALATKLAFEVAGEDRSAAVFLKLQARVQELEGKLRSAGRTGQASGDSISQGMRAATREVSNLVGSWFTLQGGVQAVSQSLQTYIRNMEEASAAGDTFARAARGFAFESAGGSRAQLQHILDTAAIHGIEKPEVAIDLADTLQDMLGGDFKAAMREFGELAKLTGAGVPAGGLKDIAVAALSRGRDPGQLGREITEVGARTGIGGEKLTNFMRGIELFPDMGEGLATAAMLMQRLGERKTQSGLTSIVDAMSDGAPKEFQQFMRKSMGLGKAATFAEKMDALATAGIDTVEKLQHAGIKEITQAQALSIAIGRRGEITGLAGSLPGTATEANLLTRIARAEEENPQLRLARQNAALRAGQANLQMLEATGIEGQLIEQRGLKVGMTLRRAGVEQFGPMDVIDSSGRATTGARILNRIDEVTGGSSITRQMDAVDRFLQRADSAFEKLERATENLRGGAALVPATEDR